MVTEVLDLYTVLVDIAFSTNRICHISIVRKIARLAQLPIALLNCCYSFIYSPYHCSFLVLTWIKDYLILNLKVKPISLAAISLKTLCVIVSWNTSGVLCLGFCPVHYSSVKKLN